jgi:hypothetical protein
MSELKLPLRTNYMESDPETLVIEDSDGNVLLSVCGDPEDEIADLILRAVNSHAALVEACKIVLREHDARLWADDLDAPRVLSEDEARQVREALVVAEEKVG